MKRSGSRLADEIVQSWNREKELKRIFNAKKNKGHKCMIDNKMQCDKCQYRENCDDKEGIE